MFDSDILEVAIGLSLMFALVSTICMAVREWLESRLKTRASYLEYGIRQLLNDPRARGLARDVFDHPLISGLYIGNYEGRLDEASPANALPVKGADDKPMTRKLMARNPNLPSYIPAQNFTKALIDVIARGPAVGVATESSLQPISLARFRGNLAHIENQQVQRALLTALDSAAGDLERLRTHIEAWYDSAMDRVSGWYKRTTQTMLLVISFATVAILNVNAIRVADYLFRHDTERQALVASIQAPSPTQAPAPGTDQKQQAIDAGKQLEAMHLPIGWSGGENWFDGWGAPRTRGEEIRACGRNCPTSVAAFSLWRDLVAPLVGWLITAFAATLGAPFWFDVLSKFMTVRSTLKPRPEDKKTEETASTDTKSGTSTAASGAITAAAAAVTASQVAHDADDSCGVGTSTPPTPDDRLPAATGGVA